MQAWRVKVSENICVSGRENATCWHLEGSLLIANNGVAKKCTACSLFPCLYWLLGFKSRNILIGSVLSKVLQNSNSSFQDVRDIHIIQTGVCILYTKKESKLSLLYCTLRVYWTIVQVIPFRCSVCIWHFWFSVKSLTLKKLIMVYLLIVYGKLTRSHRFTFHLRETYFA